MYYIFLGHKASSTSKRHDSQTQYQDYYDGSLYQQGYESQYYLNKQNYHPQKYSEKQYYSDPSCSTTYSSVKYLEPQYPSTSETKIASSRDPRLQTVQMHKPNAYSSSSVQPYSLEVPSSSTDVIYPLSDYSKNISYSSTDGESSSLLFPSVKHNYLYDSSQIISSDKNEEADKSAQQKNEDYFSTSKNY